MTGIRTEPVDECPACGSRLFAPYSIGAPSDLRRCRECHLVFAPAVAAAEEIYVDGYLSGESDLGFGLDVTHPAFQEFLDHCADQRVHWVERWAPGRGSWLDVGCGSGEVLGAAGRAGWSAVGVEPVSASVKWAKEQRPHVEIREAFLADSGLAERSWDVVSAFHVLEHMSHAVEFVQMISRWAKPGALVVIEVPNIGSYHRKGSGGQWPGLRPLEHVGHFTPRTLSGLLIRAGLAPLEVSTRGFPYREQTLDEALADLGLLRYRRFARWIGRDAARADEPVIVPTAPGWHLIRAMHEAYRWLGIGQVNFAIARVR